MGKRYSARWLEPKAVRLLLKDIARADCLSRHYSPGAKLVVDHTLKLYELTPNLVQGLAHQIEAGNVALPLTALGSAFWKWTGWSVGSSTYPGIAFTGRFHPRDSIVASVQDSCPGKI